MGSSGITLVFEDAQLREFHFEDLQNLVVQEERLFDGGIEAVEAREESLITVRSTASYRSGGSRADSRGRSRRRKSLQND